VAVACGERVGKWLIGKIAGGCCVVCWLVLWRVLGWKERGGRGQQGKGGGGGDVGDWGGMAGGCGRGRKGEEKGCVVMLSKSAVTDSEDEEGVVGSWEGGVENEEWMVEKGMA